jgi:hypothetical protein
MDKDFLTFIEGCLAGDNASWTTLRSLVLQYLKGHYAYLSQDHEDIAQEISINLKRGLRQFQGTIASGMHHYWFDAAFSGIEDLVTSINIHRHYRKPGPVPYNVVFNLGTHGNLLYHQDAAYLIFLPKKMASRYRETILHKF